uniref:EF-hand domain-containing protein n=1 Tax=Oryzias latipes TaxID=8090 RepID=A0A3P9KKK9_ORYLA
MARMEKAIKDIVDMFLEYANGDGKLSKDELKKMIEKEIQNPELKVSDPFDFDKAMKRMDKNRDGEIDFKEFLKCMSSMAKCYHHKKTGNGKESFGIQRDKPT